MKSLNINRSGILSWCCGALAVFAALLVWTQPALAGDREAVEVQFFPYDKITQVSATPGGAVHVYIKTWSEVTSDNPLLNGYWVYDGHGTLDAEYNANGWSVGGRGVFEVGSWDEDNVFTSFGVFESVWHATGSMLGPMEVTIIAHGVDGAVKGMQLTLAAPNWPFSMVATGELLNPKAEK